MRFLKETGSNVVLLLLGRRTLAVPGHPQILSPGYVSEYVKQRAIERSDVVAAPSPFESLGMAALEALLAERPLLVNGRCDVLVGHCMRSNGGLWYRSYEDFAEALARLLGDPELRRALGSQGRAYVESRYRWPVVLQHYREVLDAIMAPQTK
jgi:glycosyltransferase involved in cell wall biosynthesis